MTRTRRLVLWSLLSASVIVLPGSRALAGCHSFAIQVSPATVAEGATVTVTVTRDNAVNPSSVNVSSVDETATAGSDYPEVRRTISFTTETSQQFTLAITDDPTSEGAETFRLQLSAGGGCQVNPNFQYGSPARVTIAASDAAPQTSAAQPTVTATVTATPRPSPRATTTAAATPTPSPSPAPAATVLATATSSPEALAQEEEDAGGGFPVGAIIAIVAVALAAAAGAGIWWTRRRSA
jgi:cobalamin biosynthesis Mg chelatase CobN